MIGGGVDRSQFRPLRTRLVLICRQLAYRTMLEQIGDVFRVEVPLPFRPRSVNAYLIPSGGEGWVLVDGGIDDAGAWRALDEGVRRAVGWAAVAVHVVTHMHVDHLGLVRQVRETCGAPLVMGELDADRAAHAAAHPEEEESYRLSLFRSHGVPEPVIEALGEGHPPPSSRRWVRPDHALPCAPARVPGAAGWTACWSPGHTAGHIALFRDSDATLVSGDAVLPRVSPTIGVNRQREDPVGDYLETLDRLEALDPVTILPGHGRPLAGGARIRELRAEALAESERVAALLGRDPASAWTIAERRYGGRELPLPLRLQGFRETLAHLRRLVQQERARESIRSGRSLFAGA
jgi:glyoxylase-like metal-dependent hydrolase (beta-lactamase superfamily II)